MQTTVEIAAKFFSRQLNADDTNLEALYKLGDKWKEIYEEHRSQSFQTGQFEANKYVLQLLVQNKEERIKQLEEGLRKISLGPMAGDRNDFTDHCVEIAKQLLNNK